MSNTWSQELLAWLQRPDKPTGHMEDKTFCDPILIAQAGQGGQCLREGSAGDVQGLPEGSRISQVPNGERGSERKVTPEEESQHALSSPEASPLPPVLHRLSNPKRLPGGDRVRIQTQVDFKKK